MKRQRIRVKHILDLLNECHPDAYVDFYNYGTNFDDADLSQLEIRGGKHADDETNIFIQEIQGD